jgi:hypothetical protein
MFGKVAERAEATYKAFELIKGDNRIVVVRNAHVISKSTAEAATVSRPGRGLPPPSDGNGDEPSRSRAKG